MKLRAALLLLSLSFTLATPRQPDMVHIKNISRRSIWVYLNYNNDYSVSSTMRLLSTGGKEILPSATSSFEYNPVLPHMQTGDETEFTIIDRIDRGGRLRGTHVTFNVPACPGGLLITFESGEVPQAESIVLSTYPEVPFNPEVCNISGGTLEFR